jgi:hypothetical protein
MVAIKISVCSPVLLQLCREIVLAINRFDCSCDAMWPNYLSEASLHRYLLPHRAARIAKYRITVGEFVEPNAIAVRVPSESC